MPGSDPWGGSSAVRALERHRDYTYEVWPREGEVCIDIRSGDGGWLGCGHSGEVTLTRAEVERMVLLLGGRVAWEESRPDDLH